MTSPAFLRISNTPRDYGWGMPGGISRALGGAPTDALEAELWLGAHPLSPSRVDDAPWADLAEWEQAEGARLPYLMKVLGRGRRSAHRVHLAAVGIAGGCGCRRRTGAGRAA